ncbi:MAG: hypothetical protein KAW09_01120, partial [Thermoplasmata archaeon]|nr:hypothetical protein [Thermoplasmata archaeon]
NLTFSMTGWQLISIPRTVADTSVDMVFQSISGSYDQLRVFDAKTGTWLHYDVSKPYLGSLTNVDKTMGIWIRITSVPATLHITGDLTYVTEIHLEPGWNLIGYPSLNTTGMTVGDLLNNTAYGIDAVEGFDGLRAPYYLRNDLSQGYYLQPGEGYWVHVSSTTGRTLPVLGGF